MIISIISSIAIFLSIISFIINWNISKKMKQYLKKQEEIIILYSNKYSDDKKFVDKLNKVMRNKQINAGGRV